ncbi:MAG: phosphopantothenate/pantothenate synthetase [Candidatus Lokiarchaeota archaeon]|nr:phosphopantothenate/pantothenate synthetase [Candidatus Lokiarchaeota archaeon]
MVENKNNNHKIPKDHPRYQSLKYRHQIIEGMKCLVVTEAGLIAHGRGECFDYILGEKTSETAYNATRAAIAALLLAENPIISVNGNVTALIPKKLAELSNLLKIPLEINLFYGKKGRIEAITEMLESSGALDILGKEQSKMVEINELSSNRRKVDPKGIQKSDIVMVPLEDGDRTEALKKLGKTIITVDLNPISRTSLNADITIVDNIIRTIPLMIEIYKELKNFDKKDLEDILSSFNNKENIGKTLDLIIDYIKKEKIKLLNEL